MKKNIHFSGFKIDWSSPLQDLTEHTNTLDRHPIIILDLKLFIYNPFIFQEFLKLLSCLLIILFNLSLSDSITRVVAGAHMEYAAFVWHVIFMRILTTIVEIYTVNKSKVQNINELR